MESVVVIAAVISALGALVGALAAWRSAESAKLAQERLDESELAALRTEVATSAAELRVATRRATERVSDAKLSYKSLFGFSAGGGSSSRLQMYLAQLDETEKELLPHAEYAALFDAQDHKLRDADHAELRRIGLRLRSSITEVSALIEDLQREIDKLDAQSAQFREQALRGDRG